MVFDAFTGPFESVLVSRSAHIRHLADDSEQPRVDPVGMSMKKVLLGFLPWVVFTLVSTRLGPGAVATACVLAFLVAGGLIVRARLHHESAKLLEVTGAVVFLGLAVLAAAWPAADGFLAGYGRALAAAVLAVVIFVLLPVLPFTEQYARENVPREYWHSPRFRSINRRISAAWGGVVAVMAVSHALAGTVEVPEPGVGPLHRPVDLLFNWIVPGLLVWAAVSYTQRVTGEGGDHAPAASPASGVRPAGTVGGGRR